MSTHKKKRERFERLAEKRTNEVLKKLDILGNCSNRSNYEYTRKDVKKIFRAIDEKKREVKSRFKFPAEDSKKFEL